MDVVYKPMRATYIILICLVITSCGTFSQKKDQGFDRIDIADVKRVEIELGPKHDTTNLEERKRSLPFEKVSFFIDNWNDSRSAELMKYIPEYKIHVYLHSDSIRTFRINGNKIKENGDWTRTVPISAMGDSIWEMAFKY